MKMRGRTERLRGESRLEIPLKEVRRRLPIQGLLLRRLYLGGNQEPQRVLSGVRFPGDRRSLLFNQGERALN